MPLKSPTPSISSIPISWLKQYANDNGPEIKEIIDYMLQEYKNEQRVKKGK